jgi:hypothetical protein
MVSSWGKFEPKAASEAQFASDVNAIAKEAAASGAPDGVIREKVNQWWSRQEATTDDHLVLDESALAELRNSLIGESSRAKVRSRVQRSAAWVFDHYVAVASLVAVVATGFYGLAYERFYASLNISPEQAGLSPTEVLAHSAVGGLVMTVFIAFVFFFSLLPIVPIREDPQAREVNGSWRDFATNALITAAGIVGLFALAGIVRAPLYAPLVMSCIPLGFLLLYGVRPRGKSRLPFSPRPLLFRRGQYGLAFAISLPIALICAGAITVDKAVHLGHRASEGKAIQAPTVAGFPFLGVKAEPALITWRKRDPLAAGIPRCVFYLGYSDGDAVLYDHRTDAAFQVPADEMAIQLRGDISSCEAPVDGTPPTVRWVNHKYLECMPGHWHSFISPWFNYSWTAQGYTLARAPRHGVRRLPVKRMLPGTKVRCRVSAWTVYGEQLALSKPVRLH